jgi:hypothetical protein
MAVPPIAQRQTRIDSDGEERVRFERRFERPTFTRHPIDSKEDSNLNALFKLVHGSGQIVTS